MTHKQPGSQQSEALLETGRVPLHRYLWCVAAATFLVALCPVALVWWLRSAGLVGSGALGVVIAIALSLAASRAGAGFWKTRKGAGDILFNELLAWGFIRRWRSERRLASAHELLGALSERPGDGDGQAEERRRALEQLSSTLEATDPHTHGHSRRVARHAWMIAKQMGLRGENVARVKTAAALHDVGKLHTPPSVLRKPGRLTDAEYEVIKRHPVDGAAMVAALGDKELTSIVRHHHERLDGTGYPQRLSGEEIPLGARIIAVADTFDAITSARPYRPARRHKEALDILKYEAGTQLDPAVVKAFCGIYSGRTPLALWASLTSLPAQAFSWAGGTAVGAASAAQVAAVAAVAAVGTVAAPPAVHRHHAPLPMVAHTSEVASSAGGPTVAAGGHNGTPARPGAHTRAGRPGAGAGKQPAGPHATSPGGAHATAPASGGSRGSSVQPAAGAAPQDGAKHGEAPHEGSPSESPAPGGAGQGSPPKSSPPPVSIKPPVGTGPGVHHAPRVDDPAGVRGARTADLGRRGNADAPKPEKPEKPVKPEHAEIPSKSGSGEHSGTGWVLSPSSGSALSRSGG